MLYGLNEEIGPLSYPPPEDYQIERPFRFLFFSFLFFSFFSFLFFLFSFVLSFFHSFILSFFRSFLFLTLFPFLSLFSFPSEATSHTIDLEVRKIVASAIEKTTYLLEEKKVRKKKKTDHHQLLPLPPSPLKDLVVKIGEKLLEKEVLSREDMVDLAGERPFKQVTTYEEFLDNSLAPEEKEGEKEK